MYALFAAKIGERSSSGIKFIPFIRFINLNLTWLIFLFIGKKPFCDYAKFNMKISKTMESTVV